MKIYLADSIKNVENTRKVAEELKKMGHEVTSSWLDQNFEGQTADPTHDLDLCAKYASENLSDIDNAEVLVFFFEEMKSPGKNVEFGYALGSQLNPLIYVVGEWNSIFHALADYFFKDTEEFLEYMREMPKENPTRRILKK